MFTNIDDDSRSLYEQKLGGGCQEEHDLCFVYLIIHVFMTGLSAVYWGKGLSDDNVHTVDHKRYISLDKFIIWHGSMSCGNYVIHEVKEWSIVH